MLDFRIGISGTTVLSPHHMKCAWDELVGGGGGGAILANPFLRHSRDLVNKEIIGGRLVVNRSSNEVL